MFCCGRKHVDFLFAVLGGKHYLAVSSKDGDAEAGDWLRAGAEQEGCCFLLASIHWPVGAEREKVTAAAVAVTRSSAKLFQHTRVAENLPSCRREFLSSFSVLRWFRRLGTFEVWISFVLRGGNLKGRGLTDWNAVYSASKEELSGEQCHLPLELN